MSKLNQIQKALTSIDQASFQKLCDAYLHRKLDIKEIDSVGSVAGENKTRTGHPDTLITLKNDKYVFLEATTEKSGLLAKFTDDLDECFNEEKTGIQLAEVEKIILACNRKLSHKDKTTLIKKGQDKGCVAEFLDLDTLSFELYQKFQPLAKEFLGIELDTGQILKPVDFIKDYQKSKFATPLDNEFYFRETEKTQILEALKNQDLIILSGKAGVGKSKLALECAKEFTESNRSFQCFCITNKNRDLYENLKAYFGDDENYLIIVDDANRLSQRYHILQLLHEQTVTRKIKIILTVRDYARNQVRSEAKNYSPIEIELQKFSYQEIAKILESFGIRNYKYIDRIYKISDGNARLAIMAARLALDENTLDSINDVSDLYDIYFDSINEDLKVLGNEDLIQIAGIISFFRALDRTRTEFFENVAQSFGLTVDELWIGLEKLHDLEIVDLDFEAAKISDQILGTYLFYKAFFKDEVLDFSILLSNDFEKISYRLTDAINPVLNTFNTKLIVGKLQPHIDRRWTEIKEDETKALAFIKLFYYLKETEFLVYLKRRIDSVDKIIVKESDLQFTSKKHEYISDKYLQALKLFQGENIEIVFDLIFEYLELNLSLLPQVIYLLTHDFHFNQKSRLFSFYIQRSLISKLIEKSKAENADLYQKIFLQISGKFAELTLEHSSSDRIVINPYKPSLSPIEAMVDIRENLWKRLIEIYKEGKYQAEVFRIIKNYNKTWRKDEVNNEIIKKDVEMLLPFITSLNSENYQDCVLANAFFDFLENFEVDFDKSLRTGFTNKTFEISEVLLNDDRRELKLGFEEYERYKKERLESYFKSYKLEDYQELLIHCEIIQNHLDENQNLYQLHYPLINVLVNVAERNKELFIEVINYLLKSGNQLYLAGHHIVYKLIEKIGNPRDVYENINEIEFNAKNNWLFGFFQSLTNKLTNEYFLNELYRLYQSADLVEVPQSFEYLNNYAHLDKDIFSKVIRILFERSNPDGEGFNFHHLLNYDSVSERLGEILAKELPLLKGIYIYQNKYERYSDYKSKALRQIFMLDNTFVFEYLEFLLKEGDSYRVFHNGNTDFLFIWEQDNYKDLFKSLLNFTYEKENENDSLWSRNYPSYIELALIGLNSKEGQEDKQKERNEQKEKAIILLKEILKENAKDKRKASYVFQLVVNCFGDKRKEFLEIFLKENKNLEDFKWLSFETNHSVVSDAGSGILIYENKIKFYESLLPLFTSIDLLEHKLIIEERIKDYKQYIEDSRKRDFIGHF